MKNEVQNMITILGPTASGKTNVACALALKLSGEIISADSRQVYRGMDIGTGKDIEEYEVGGEQIPYHLIDIKEPGYKYNIAEFQRDFIEVFQDISSRGKFPILCGGSGLYIEAAIRGNSFLGIPMDLSRQADLELLGENELKQLFNNLSARVRESLDSGTRRRLIRAIIVDEYLKLHPDFKTTELPSIDNVIFGISIERDLRREKITNRLSHRMNHGLIDEVRDLMANGLTFESLDYYGLEYKWVGRFIKGDISKKELFNGLNIAIHQFAKRQMTWFRRMEKQGFDIHWIEASNSLETKVDQILSIYHEKLPLKR